jgi:hypothetical protein
MYTGSLDMLTRLKALGPVSYLLIGVASAVIGLLPWLISGMRLPLQNLWAVDTSPAGMPITLLPFSQYALTLIVAVIVTGSAIAGSLARVTRAWRPRFALSAMVVGVIVVHAIAAVQTTVTVSNGLRKTTVANAYLAALVAGTIAAILIGLLVLLLIAAAPAAGAVIAASIASLTLSAWLDSIVLPFSAMPTDSNTVLFGVVRWVPAVVVGLAVAWCGLQTIGRVVAAIVSLLVLWVGSAVFTAVSVAAGTRVLAPHPAEMVDYGAQVFVGALGVPGGSLSLLVAAIIAIGIGLAARWAIRRWRLEPTPAGLMAHHHQEVEK